MPLEEVERRTLWLTVWHSDMFGRNDFLGEVMLPINTIPLDDPQPRWFSLQDRVSYKSIQIRNIIYFHFFGTSRHNILHVLIIKNEPLISEVYIVILIFFIGFIVISD